MYFMSEYKKELTKVKEFKRSKSEPEIPKYNGKPKKKKFRLVAKPKKEYVSREIERIAGSNGWWLEFIKEDLILGNYHKFEDAKKAMEKHKKKSNQYSSLNDENYDFFIEEK